MGLQVLAWVPGNRLNVGPGTLSRAPRRRDSSARLSYLGANVSSFESHRADHREH
jgi:hypothetical protein